MGVVYLAKDKRLDRQVALKIPFLWGDEDPEFLHRFYREARAAAGLRHPNICPVYDVGEHEGQPFLIMAYIEGVLLSDHLKKRSSPMEPREAIRLVRKLAQVMDAAHQQGIVHRDLKPANIMLDLKAGPIVMDFGLARREDREESVRTRAGQQLGSPAYMPLEQFQGRVEAIGPRSDIYSLGVILFELLTGRRPYEGNAFEIHMKLLRSYPPAPSSLRLGLDPALDWICQKAMARDIEDRYASMKDFDQALKGITSQESGKATRPGSPEEVSAAAARIESPVRSADTRSSGEGSSSRLQSPPIPAPGESVSPWMRNVPAWVVVIAAVMPVVVLLLFIWASSHDGTGATKSPPSEARSPAPGKATVVAKRETRPPVEPSEAPPREPAKVASSPGTPPESTGQPVAAAPRAPADVPARKTAASPREITSPSTGMVLVRIEPGEFMMGSSDADKDAQGDEKPLHRVRITRPFYLGKHEVTQAEYKSVMGENPSSFKGSDRNPVEQVFWLDAARFCNQLSEREGLKPFYEISGEAVKVPDWNGPGYRLPTEAEWEYACRAGTSTRFCFGDDEASLGEYAWFNGNASKETHEVGQKRANGFGLHDMHGNVWEWCGDWYSADYYKESPVNDPRGPSQATGRVVRGGSWYYGPDLVRSADRDWDPPDFRGYILGFRVARVQSGG
jgi:formylglycine-generating enzyme required for sulfatase activity